MGIDCETWCGGTHDDWCGLCNCQIGNGSCAGCVAASCIDDGLPSGSYCGRCGKEFEDFSDLGCELCDARHPGFGVS